MRRWRAMRLNGVLCFVLRDLASCKVQLSKTRIEPLITSQLQVEPVLQMAGVGHCCCRARARDGAWMTRLARTRARAHKGGQSGSMSIPEYGPAPRAVLCAVSTRHPAYLDPAGTVCRARFGDGAWLTKLARTRAQAHKGGQSGYIPMPEDGPAPRAVLCAVSTPLRQTWRFANPSRGSSIWARSRFANPPRGSSQPLEGFVTPNTGGY